MVPLSAFATFEPGHTPLSVNHQGHFAASTISFNLAPGNALSEAQKEIDERPSTSACPRPCAAPSPAPRRPSSSRSPAAAAVRRGVADGLYRARHSLREYIHPITILSTLPPASVGALIALKLFDTEFTIIAAIGIILLIGIVKKNAIMMIDFALQASARGSTRARRSSKPA